MINPFLDTTFVLDGNQIVHYSLATRLRYRPLDGSESHRVLVRRCGNTMYLFSRFVIPQLPW